jgi:hypothetical protein
MTKYVMRDEDGRVIYKGETFKRPRYNGETINGRRYQAASHIGYLPGGLMMVAVFCGLLALGAPWFVAVLGGGLAGQVLVLQVQRAYSRRIWKLERTAVPDDITTPKPESDEAREARIAREARQEKIRQLKVSVEAELPHIDYDSGEVLTPGNAADLLAELEAEEKALAAPPPEDEPEPARWGTLRAIEAGPQPRIMLGDGRVVDLSPDDLTLISALAGAHFAPDTQWTMPSGIKLSGAELARVVHVLAAYRAHLPWGAQAAEVAADEISQLTRPEPYQQAVDRTEARRVPMDPDALDREQVRAWAGNDWTDYPPGTHVTMASGREWLSERVNREVRQARSQRLYRLGRYGPVVETFARGDQTFETHRDLAGRERTFLTGLGPQVCSHLEPIHTPCPQCMIDLRTRDGQVRAQGIIDSPPPPKVTLEELKLEHGRVINAYTSGRMSLEEAQGATAELAAKAARLMGGAS